VWWQGHRAPHRPTPPPYPRPALGAPLPGVPLTDYRHPSASAVIYRHLSALAMVAGALSVWCFVAVVVRMFRGQHWNMRGDYRYTRAREVMARRHSGHTSTCPAQTPDPAQQVPAVQRRVFAPLVADVTEVDFSDSDTLGGERLPPTQRRARITPGAVDVAHQVPQVPQVGPGR